MRKIFISFILLFSFIYGDNNVSIVIKYIDISPKFSNKDIEFAKWMISAYKYNNDKDFYYISYILSSTMFKRNRNSTFPIAIFISKRIQQNDSFLSKINIDSIEDKTLLMISLKQANTKESIKLFNRILPTIKNKKIRTYFDNLFVINIEKIDITSSSILDMLWASYFATGDKMYVHRILGVILENDSDASIEKINLVKNAYYSLLSNAKTNDKVIDITRDYIFQYNKLLRKDIKILLKEYQ